MAPPSAINMASLTPHLAAAQSQRTGYSGTDTSDLSLVRRAQSGESGAFDQLVLKYRTKIVKLAMRYTRTHEDAEDATQETFIRAYRGLQRSRCECAFYTWLYRIAINSARNVRSAHARNPVGRAIDLHEDREATNLASCLQDLETPEELALADDIRAMVNSTLEALPEAHRTAIVLCEIDCLTYEEIAAAMATPVGTVRSRVFRAREVIHHQLRQVSDKGLERDDGRRPSPAPRLLRPRPNVFPETRTNFDAMGPNYRCA
jgi:RNA polymerase sigma-70 factor (ECF subfamily)